MTKYIIDLESDPSGHTVKQVADSRIEAKGRIPYEYIDDTREPFMVSSEAVKNYFLYAKRTSPRGVICDFPSMGEEFLALLEFNKFVEWYAKQAGSNDSNAGNNFCVSLGVAERELKEAVSTVARVCKVSDRDMEQVIREHTSRLKTVAHQIPV